MVLTFTHDISHPSPTRVTKTSSTCFITGGSTSVTSHPITSGWHTTRGGAHGRARDTEHLARRRTGDAAKSTVHLTKCVGPSSGICTFC